MTTVWHESRLRLVVLRSLAAVTVLELLAVLVLLGLNGSSPVGAGRMTGDIILALAVAVYAGAGLLISSRLRGNAIGWLLSLIGLTLAGSMLAEQYALYGLATAPGPAPAARLAGWAAAMLAPLSIVLMFALILLFPDGRLPSRRWRPVLWAIAAVTAGWVVAAQLQTGTVIDGGITNALAPARAGYPNPVGIFPRHGWFDGLVVASSGLAVLTGVLVVASVFTRRRGAGPELRRQLAWLGYVGLLTACWATALLVVGLLAHGASSWLGGLLWALMELTLVAGIPLACAVAVLKYRLYDIDRIISRTVAYAIVTGLLIGLYAGLVLLATQVLRFHTPVAVAAATLAAAALFNPLRRRVQRAVDRHFNRSRYDAEQTVMAFAARLKDAVDLDSVRDDLTGTVHRALEPAHLSVWLSRAP